MKNTFLGKRLMGCWYALKGAWRLLKEPSIQVQLAIAAAVVCLGFWFDISKTEWILQTLAMGLVLGVEGLNTAIEEIADFIHPDFNDKIGNIKDVGAGAVFMAALAAGVVGMIIYLPKIF